MRWAVLLLAALWLSATPAEACPAGSPCLKYRRMRQNVAVPPDHFARENTSAIPKFDRKKLAHYLASSRWTPVYLDDGRSTRTVIGLGNIAYSRDHTKIRFIDATDKIPAATGNADERIVLVRQIERTNEGDVFVDVDGVAYELWYCIGKKQVPCLTTTGESFASMFPATF